MKKFINWILVVFNLFVILTLLFLFVVAVAIKIFFEM